MSNVFGDKLKISIFGESHGEAIGVVIDGLPSGIQLDMGAINAEMARRAPGNSALATPRKEPDDVKIVSGFFNGFTTGTPLCGMIYNTNTRSTDYNNNSPRPGHADFTGSVKYNGFEDFRGGGHFSGRITAPLTFAGAVAKQILALSGIVVGSHIQNIAGTQDDRFTTITESLLQDLHKKDFPLLNQTKETEMCQKILDAKTEGDSVGGVIECAVVGVPAGLGNPFFDSVESKISQMMFSIPAVKGIEFGAGFEFAQMKGSESNDPFTISGNKITTTTNHNGGINGGISNGMPIVFRLAVKATPSISKEQQTVDFSTNSQTTIKVHGRHDPCIVVRAVPVAEAGLAICVLDCLL